MFEVAVLPCERHVHKRKQPVDGDVPVPRGVLGRTNRLLGLTDGKRKRRNHGVIRLIARERAQALVERVHKIVAAEKRQEANGREQRMVVERRSAGGAGTGADQRRVGCGNPGHCNLAVERGRIRRGLTVPENRPLRIAGRVCGQARPIGRACPADRHGHRAVHTLEMEKRTARIV